MLPVDHWTRVALGVGARHQKAVLQELDACETGPG